jgi:arginyl-tRNA synthetase
MTQDPSGYDAFRTRIAYLGVPPSVITSTVRSLVRGAVEDGWARAMEAGSLPGLPADTDPPTVEVERPADPVHGDFASNLAMKLARPYRMAPLTIASSLAAGLTEKIARDPTGTPIAAAEAAAPGFLNLRLADHALETTIAGILDMPEAWGRVAPTRPRSVNVEFVSANPTGPLHIGNARGAFVGDLLCRVLEAGGQRVTREYYFNDVGGQIPNLGASIAAIRRGAAVPEDGYHGDYVHELAAAVGDDLWSQATRDEVDTNGILGHWAALRVREGIERSLASLGVRFDVWTTEASLHAGGWVDRAIERLRAQGHVYEQDGAIWFRSTEFGDDKDRVIIRSNGEPTYFAADIGYVTEKFSRGFDHLIYVWGADHHGTVARVRNAAQAMGYDPDAVQMLLYSWVRFVRDGVEVSMSKRAGDFITLDELLGEIGVDSARWFFASRSVNTGIDFDIELAKKQSNENPVYYVQYAHARIASILRKASEAGLQPADNVVGWLTDAPEAALARAVARFPEVIEDAVEAEETHGITAYATELATTFHAFYRDARVVDAGAPERSAARLALAGATRVTLANALGLLGISAPESM